MKVKIEIKKTKIIEGIILIGFILYKYIFLRNKILLLNN